MTIMIRLSLLLCRGHWSANQHSHAATESGNCRGSREVQNFRQNAYLLNEMVVSWPTFSFFATPRQQGRAGKNVWHKIEMTYSQLQSDLGWVWKGWLVQSTITNTAERDNNVCHIVGPLTRPPSPGNLYRLPPPLVGPGRSQDHIVA